MCIFVSGLLLEISIAIAFACYLVLKKLPDTDTDTIDGESKHEHTSTWYHLTYTTTAYNAPINTLKYSASQSLTAIVL